jgi:FKBP-type peptidyl-prolyl cis-trans isomerase
MKSSLALCLFAAGVVAAYAQDPKITLPPIGGGTAAPAAAAPAAPEPTFTDAQLVEEFGWFVGKRVGIGELALSKEEFDFFIKGLNAAAAGKDSPFELEKIGPKMDEFMQKKMTAHMDKLKEKNVAEATALFAKLKENKNVIELPSGLRYEILKQGEGPSPKATDIVKAHYHGTLVDGTVFDSSVQRGQPEEFPLDGVIPGWTEGLQ